MKPEELDELFRRGLADQQHPPRPQAWESIQQRLHAPIGEEDELPAFLRKAPEPVATNPMMTASRGGGGNMSISWHQRPMWRAAAVAVLAVGGLLAQQQLHQAEPAASMMAVAPAPVRPTETAPTTPAIEPQNVVPAVVAVAEPNAALPTAERQPEVSATASAPSRQERVGYALAATQVTSDLIHEHLLCSDRQCTDCDRIEQQIGPARFRNLRAEAAAQLLARTGMKVVIDQPNNQGFALASSGASRSNRRSSGNSPALRTPLEPEPVVIPEAVVPDKDPLADAVVEVKIVPDEVYIDQAEAPVVVAADAQSATSRRFSIPRPREVLRRASERMRDMIDRADHRSDGRLTIDTHVVGRPVRKTISL